jgi:death-on-curing protein
LEAAVVRPRNLSEYSEAEPSIPRLAASYGHALARGHCFPDGNKRVALSVIDVFLQLNGLELTAPDGPEAVHIIRGAAEGQIDEEELFFFD